MPPPAAQPPRLMTLILLTGVSVLSLNLFLPSLPQMTRDFRVDYAIVNLSISGYLMISAVLQLIIGPLSDRYGRRPVMLGAMGVFVLASLGCILATNIWVFLGFRMLQSAIIAGAVLSKAVIRDQYPSGQAASLLGYVAMVMAVAPMLGPTLGGAVEQLIGWRFSFVMLLLMGLVLVILTWVDLGETNFTRSETFAAQFRAYPDLLRSGLFWGYAISLSSSVGAFYTFLAGGPLVAALLFDLSPAAMGAGIGSITGGFMIGSFLAGRLASQVRLSTMMIAGRIVACGALTFGLAMFWSGAEHVLFLFGPVVFVGLGNGLTVPSANAGAMSVQPELAGSASGMSGAMMVAVGAVLSSLTAAVLTSAENAPFTLFGVMLATAVCGLASAVYVRRNEDRLFG
jgi:MFS transporter, DHA1 family, multidrug resistance protein